MAGLDTVVSLTVDALDRHELLRYLGYRGQALTDDLAARLEGLERRCLELARPRACLRVFDVADPAPSPAKDVPEIHLDGCALVLSGHDIASHLAGARSVGLMAVTLGSALEQELHRLALLDPTAELLLDACGTTAIEHAADAAEAVLADEAARRGLCATSRFSPGYGDLPLALQPTLLDALDASRRLGIGLTDSLLMIPTKSVTAVVGMTEGPAGVAPPGCDACRARDHCSIRIDGRTCHD